MVCHAVLMEAQAERKLLYQPELWTEDNEQMVPTPPPKTALIMQNEI